LKRILLIAIVSCFSFFSATAQNRAGIVATGNVVTVKFYPNPATTFINFEFGKQPDRSLSLQVYNFMGRKLFEQGNLPERMTINLTDYPRGVYIYQLRDKTGRIIESGKFQVSK
jgi:hypothetical protein